MIDKAKSKPRKPIPSHEQLMEEVKRQTGQLSAIHTVTTAVSQTLDLNVTLQTALEAVLSVIPVDASGISMIDEAAGELVLRAQRGWKNDFVTEPMRIKLGYGLSGQAVTKDEVVITGDLTDDPRLYVPAIREEEVKAMVLAPMHARGRVVGVLSVMSYKPYIFDETEVAVMRAIADQVGVALDNARLYESVREQQSRLQAVLQSTADAIIATDSHGIINLVNHAAETLFQIDAQTVMGHSWHNAPLPASFNKNVQEALSTDGMSSGLTFEVMLENEHCLAAVVSPVSFQGDLDARGTEGWVAVFQDITHMKEAERARLQFIQTAAHDLRNPLAVTLSALTMLNKQIHEPTPTQQEVIDIALNGINRMQDLIDDLMDIEHIDSGVDLRSEPVSLPDLLERCAIDMRPIFERREQSFLLFVDPNLPLFYGDERWLYRALINLLSNAHKYTQREGTVTLRGEWRAREIVVQVEDDGPGIPLDAQARLFERFYRVRRTEEKVQGTGLGLAIVKSVVEKHAGRVFVNSEPGRGSTFGMILPVRDNVFIYDEQ